jgi:hypothetical protein
MVKSGYLTMNADNAKRGNYRQETVRNNGAVTKEELTYVAAEPSDDRSSKWQIKKHIIFRLKFLCRILIN